MNGLDLFSGIGGFSLGFQRAGIKTMAFCEIEEFCQKLLIKNFPGRPIFSDIKELNFERQQEIIIANYKKQKVKLGKIGVIFGGPPCQPYSVAGKQRAEKDDRDLWPEMFRVIKEVRSPWVICENVRDFINLGFPRTKANLESIGYSVLPFEIPACAVGARHERKRNWIIAHLNSSTLQDKQRRGIRKSWEGKTLSSSFSEFWTFANLNGDGQSGKTNASKEKDNKGIRKSDGWSEATTKFDIEWTLEPEMVRNIYGLSPRLDRDSERLRRKKIGALGNSVIPQIPELIGRAIMEINTQSRRGEWE